jgi:hypothetical protein
MVISISRPHWRRAGRAQFNPEITLKALCFFDDGNLRKLPRGLKERLTAAVYAVDLERLPVIGDRERNGGEIEP